MGATNRPQELDDAALRLFNLLDNDILLFLVLQVTIQLTFGVLQATGKESILTTTRSTGWTQYSTVSVALTKTHESLN